MSYIEVFGIAVILAMDAFAISTAAGMCSKKFKLTDALKIGLCFGGFQFIMPLIGCLLGTAFADKLAAIDHYIAFGLLLFIGGKMVIDSIKDLKSGDSDLHCTIINSLPILLLQGVATSIDAFATGVTFAFELDMSIWLATGTIGVVTFAICIAGGYLGKAISSAFGKWASIVGGVVLIGIGTKMLVEGLING